MNEAMLRPAHPDDTERLVEVYLSARLAAPMPPPVHSRDHVASWLSEKVADGLIWVAEVEGQVQALMSLTPTWLDDLYVAPAAQGQGLGSALLDLAKALTPDGFCLWVFESNRPARDFYLRHGLRERERTDGADNEEQAPDVRMCWPGRGQ